MAKSNPTGPVCLQAPAQLTHFGPKCTKNRYTDSKGAQRCSTCVHVCASHWLQYALAAANRMAVVGFGGTPCTCCVLGASTVTGTQHTRARSTHTRAGKDTQTAPRPLPSPLPAQAKAWARRGRAVGLPSNSCFHKKIPIFTGRLGIEIG